MKKLILALIKSYQRFPFFDNPISHLFLGPGAVCRFTPRCSDYAYQAVEKYGVIKGGKLACARMARCQPFSKGGLDPLV